MTVEPTCPKCNSREHFKMMDWPIKNATETSEIDGFFVYCGKCGAVVNWIRKSK